MSVLQLPSHGDLIRPIRPFSVPTWLVVGKERRTANTPRHGECPIPSWDDTGDLYIYICMYMSAYVCIYIYTFMYIYIYMEPESSHGTPK